MKRIFGSLLSLLMLGSGLSHGADLPFFSTLRNAVTTQLTIASNTPPLDKKLVTALGKNLKLIDKTKPDWLAASAALGTLAKDLSSLSLSNTFRPLLTDTREVYLNAMETESGYLESRLATTIPGAVQTKAWAKLDALSSALHETRTNASFSLSFKSLSLAAKALVAAQKEVAKAEAVQPKENSIVATITESGQPVMPFKPTEKTIVDATYDPYRGEIDIEAGTLQNLGQRRAAIRFLALTAIVPGPGSYTLSLTNSAEAYAYYERSLVPDIRAADPEVQIQQLFPTIDPFNHRLGSGTLNITLDAQRKFIWGDFTFNAKGSEDANLEVTMTGSFLLRLGTFE